MPKQELFSVLFMNNDQPTTCGVCGSTQIHECLRKNCRRTFVTITDKEFQENDFSFEELH